MNVAGKLSIITVKFGSLGGCDLDDALLIELEMKRKLMIKSGIENGLQSQETLRLSEQVDCLMNTFEKKKKFYGLVHVKKRFKKK